jgi:hypothetical protein
LYIFKEKLIYFFEFVHLLWIIFSDTKLTDRQLTQKWLIFQKVELFWLKEIMYSFNRSIHTRILSNCLSERVSGIHVEYEYKRRGIDI